MKQNVLFVVALVASLVAYGQTTVPAGASGKDPIGRIINEEVTLNLSTGTITPQSLPFDVPFVIKGIVPKNITKVSVTIIEKEYLCNGDDCLTECKSCFVQKLLSSASESDKAEGAKLLALENGPRTVSDLEQYIQILEAEVGYETEKKAKDAVEAEIKSLKEELKAKLEKKERSPCNCNECDEIDFRVCQRLCPWEASFMSRTKEQGGSAEVNQFSINVPPLKANRRYQFFFSYERSSGPERITLNGIRVPIIRSVLFREFGKNPVINFNNQSALQTLLRDAILKHYRDTDYIENINLSRQLVSASRLSAFQVMLATEVADNRTAQELFDALSVNETDNYNMHVDDGERSWDNLLRSPAFTTLLPRFRQVTQLSAAELELFSRLQSLIQQGPIIERIAGGRSTLSKPFENLDFLTFVQTPEGVDAYIANVTATLTHLRGLNADLSSPVSSQLTARLALTATEMTKYLDLASKEATLPAADLLILNGFKARIAAIENDIEKLRLLIQSIITDLLSVEVDLREHKTVLKHLNDYFLIVSEKSFSAITLDQASPLTTTADFVTRTSYYVSADVGLAYAFYEKEFSNELLTYFGVNFHLGPINKQREYRFFSKCSTLESMWKNTSIIIGFTFNEFPASGRRKHSLKDGSVLTGVGMRIFDPVRISGGVVWNKVDNPNPLESRPKLKTYPYVALSFDLDVGKYLRKFGEKVFGLSAN